MSWQSLIKPPGKDPKNINEWLALITEKIRELKQTENWYDVSRVITTSSIVDSLDSHRSDAILSANQGRTLKELIDGIEAKIVELSKNSHIDIAKLKESLDENIPKIASNIQSITDLTNRLNTLSNDVTGNRQNIESINTSLTEITSKISNLESSLNVLSDRIIKNNDAITKKVEGLETKVDQNLVKVNNEIAGITSDIGQIVGGNEILTGLNVTISSENVITTTEGKVIIKGDVISIDTRLSINVTAELLNRDCILMLTLKIKSQKQPILALVENISTEEVLISKLSIIDGKIVNNSKMGALQPINTMVGLAAENEADTIRETIPSGFIRLGELDYDYMINHENKVKIKTESVAYVNGYKVVIPKDTIINIGKAPEKESREDLLFLEVWKDEDFLKTGKVKWRIRHEINVDFDSNYDGLSWSSWYYKSLTFAQGGNPSPVCKSTEVHRIGNEHAHFKNSKGINEIETSIINFMLTNFNDPGLFVAGDGTEYYRNLLKTMDGFSYAIPMFRLYRKPSCGKSIPFEYSKINPKVEYSKFAKLMKEEKVERVVSENIQGRSLINISSENPGSSTSDPNTLSNPFNVKVTDVTIVVYNMPLGKKMSIAEHDPVTNRWIKNVFIDGISESNPITYIPKKSNTVYAGIICATTDTYGSWTKDEFKSMKILALEGDWRDKEIPEYFIGLKSLGEDDGNLITIKNGILDDVTYDVNDGNQKLTTFSEVTHVTSKNLIVPSIEANVKKGNESKTMEKLGSRLETDGAEIIEFTKIKGKTLQNLCKHNTINDFNSPAPNITSTGNIRMDFDGNIKYCFTKDFSMIKPSTTYTIFLNVVNSDIDMTIKNNTIFGGSGVFNYIGDGTFTPRTQKFVTTSKDDFTNVKHLIDMYFGNLYTRGFIEYNIVVLEGVHDDFDYNNSYFQGITSVGENEVTDKGLYPVNIKSCGKNLIDIRKIKTDNSNTVIDYSENGIVVNNNRAWFDIEVGKNKILNFSCDALFEGTNIYSNIEFYATSQDNTSPYRTWRLLGVTNVKQSQKINFSISLTGSENRVIIFIPAANNAKFSLNFIQLETGTLKTNYKKYEECEQVIYLKEPLRSLSNDVYDEIVGNKVIRRVGKLVLDGSSDEKYDVAGEGNTTEGYSMFMNISSKGVKMSSLICDKLSVLPYPVPIGSSATNFITFGNSNVIVLNTSKTNLSTHDVAGFKTWLSKNPITVYYELKTPIEEYIENVYDKESIKTYQLDAPLRSLPNGIKDEIKDGVLIRRCGEITYNEKHYFTVISNNRTHTIVFNIDKLNDMNPSHVLCVDKFPSKYVWDVDEEGMWIDNNGYVYISILKSKLTPTQDSEGLKSYLKSNNIKVIYPLIVNDETILTEVKPQSSNFSLQRQFTEGNWLRELPNGVKDTIENGKVIRRVGEKILNGSDAGWREGSNNNDKSKWFYLHVPSAVGDSHDKIMMLSNNISCVSRLELLNKFNAGEDFTAISINGGNYIELVISRNKLSQQTLESFKTWLSQNPITILYELTEQKVEDLSIDNYMNYPYHSFNTYCGNIYVGDGRNYVSNENKLPSENNLIINTEFREINSKERVDDCNYKKSVEGYDTQYLTSSSKNLIDISSNNILNNNLIGFNYQELDNGFIVSNTIATSYSSIRFRVHLKAGVTYKIIYESSGPYATADLKTMTLGYICHLDNGTIFKVNDTGYHSVNFYCTRANSTTASATFRNIRIIEGETSVPFQPYIKSINYFENMDENDIDDLRHQVSLTGFNYSEILDKSFDSLLRGEL